MYNPQGVVRYPLTKEQKASFIASLWGPYSLYNYDGCKPKAKTTVKQHVDNACLMITGTICFIGILILQVLVNGNY